MRLLLLPCALGLVATSTTPGTPDRLLPDTHGRIESAVCVVNSARRAALRNAASTSAILGALPPRTRIHLFTNDRAAFELDDQSPHARVTFGALPADSSFTIWPQDPFLVLQGDSTTLLLPAEFPREDDRLLAEHIAKTLPATTTRRSILNFEGGNIVSSDQHVFIGVDTITQNAIRLKRPLEAIAELFARELGRPVVVVGTSPQVIAHLDLVLTPLGDRSVLLADPVLGAALAEKAGQEMPAEVLRFENDCHANFFSHPAVRELVTSDGEVLRAPRLMGQTRGAVAHSRTLREHFEALATDLRSKGFEVHRLPILVDARWTGESPDPGPAYPLLSYNNVLLETHAETRTVYLPRYGFPPLDEAARHAWQELGWDPVRVDNLSTGAMYGGALRCATKVLRRSP